MSASNSARRGELQLHDSEQGLMAGLDEVVTKYCASSLLPFPNPTWRDIQADAVVLPRRGRIGVVILMPTLNLVLKVYREPNDGIQNELEADLVARNAGLSEWMPNVLGSGKLSGQRRFIVQTFAANEVKTPHIASRRWHQYCTQELWPVLLRLHMMADPQLAAFDSSIADLRQKILGHPNIAVLLQLLSAAEANSVLSVDSDYVMSGTHGDIVPGHIHISSSGTTIIDWGSFARRPTIAEYCLRFTRSGRRTDRRASQFWSRLLTDEPLPPGVIALTRDVAEWQRMEFSLSVDSQAIKAQLLLNFCKSAISRWNQEGRDLSAKKYRQRVTRMGLGSFR